MPFELPDADPPTAVELDREHGLTVQWPDGVEAKFALDELRRNCPCAECRGVREQGRVPGPAPSAVTELTALGGELVGGWGMQIHWSDGHQTGIYAWSMLRAWTA